MDSFEHDQAVRHRAEAFNESSATTEAATAQTFEMDFRSREIRPSIDFLDIAAAFCPDTGQADIPKGICPVCPGWDVAGQWVCCPGVVRVVRA